MTFMKAIPSPEFTLLSKNKLKNICEALTTYSCIRGATVFNQDDPFKYIHIVKKGLFASQVRMSVSHN